MWQRRASLVVFCIHVSSRVNERLANLDVVARSSVNQRRSLAASPHIKQTETRVQMQANSLHVVALHHAPRLHQHVVSHKSNIAVFCCCKNVGHVRCAVGYGSLGEE